MSLLRFASCIILGGLASAPVWAVDCWPTPRAEHQPVPGASAMAAAIGKASALLSADPGLNALPDTLRLQIKSTLSAGVDDEPLPVAEIGAHGHREPVWGPGCSLQQSRADYVSPFNVAVHLNTLDPVWHTLANPADVDAQGWFAPVGEVEHVRGDRLHGGRVLVLSRPDRPALVPLTVDAFHDFHEKLLRETLETMRAWHEISPDAASVVRAEQQLAALLAHRRSLSPAQKAAQAHLAPSMGDAPPWVAATADARGAIPLFQPNPSLWQDAKPGDIRVITVSLWMNNEGDELQSALESWVANVDLRPYEALLSP